jgi:hypothetical protein
MTLRSILLGDCDHYLSPYIFAVAQGMARLGHWHTQISLRHPPELLKQRIRDIRPDLLWTHMLLWPPPGSPPVERLISLCEGAAKQGARVILHDGDYKERTRFPHSLAGWCALALCNHLFDRSAWKVPTLHWPYCAFSQDAIAPPVSAWSCDLWFAGQRSTDKVYAVLPSHPRFACGPRFGLCRLAVPGLAIPQGASKVSHCASGSRSKKAATTRVFSRGNIEQVA